MPDLPRDFDMRPFEHDVASHGAGQCSVYFGLTARWLHAGTTGRIYLE